MDLGKIPAGKLLCYHTVLDAIDRGLDIYDFGYGGDDYKFVFTQTQRTLKSVVLAKRDELPDLDHLFTKFEYVEIG
jgi:CelD/BcsL family acetyltransferase involved in cellulose biosynthesis